MASVHVLSADGKNLATIESRGWVSEPYAGGTSYRPDANAVHLINLETWRKKTAPLPGKGWAGPLAFSPQAASLLLVQHEPESSTLMLYDVDTGKLVAERVLDFRPALVAYTQNGTTLVVYGQPLGSPPGIGKPESPRLLLADAITFDVRWEQPLEDLASGYWCLEACNEPHGAQLFAEWRPAVVLSHDGRKLYIMHADQERLTTIDLDAQTIHSVEVQAARSWFEQLLALTAGVAQAKGGVTGAIKEAVLSPDGKQLYVVSQTMSSSRDTDGNSEEIQTRLDLQVIAVESGRTVMSRNLEISGTWVSADRVQLTPDGVYLVVNGWRDGERWTEVFNAKRLERVAHLAGWQVVLTRRLDSQPIILAQRWHSEKQTELAVLDPRSFDIVDSWVESNASWVTP
jgi:hypothetical protein